MSRRLHQAPLALAADGTVLLNLAQLDVPDEPQALLDAALAQPGRVFIGVALGRAEVSTALRRLQDGADEAAAYAAGARQRSVSGGR